MTIFNHPIIIFYFSTKILHHFPRKFSKVSSSSKILNQGQTASVLAGLDCLLSRLTLDEYTVYYSLSEAKTLQENANLNLKIQFAYSITIKKVIFPIDGFSITVPHEESSINLALGSLDLFHRSCVLILV